MIRLILITTLISILGASLYFSYKKGFEAGVSKATLEFRAAQEHVRELRTKIENQHKAKYEKDLQKSSEETRAYLEKLRKEQQKNKRLKTALNKSKDVIDRYKACTYTEEDYSNDLKLYR